MKQYIELNKESFELKKVKGELYPITQVRCLDDCYAKPSNAKRAIYNYWLGWYMKEDNNFILKHFSINSYNVNMFTLICDVYNTDNVFLGHIYISKTRQEFWTI